jgi:cytochrome c oxidase subunit III
MHTDAAIDHGHANKPPHLRFQFSDPERQFHAAKFGMWLFLGQEVMFFSALLCAYAYYRNQFPDAWYAASQHLKTGFGLGETIDLLFSSFTIALAIHFARLGKRNITSILILVTLVCGLGFLVAHSYEYYTDFLEGHLPGRFFHPEPSDHPMPLESAMFFTCYFFTTVLHSIHVLIGVGVLAVVLVFNIRGKYSPAHYTHIEITGLYWHLVDLIWIFLFPLYYLVSK